ncbi:glycosyltransferase family 2 protein [Botryobasidium botryosum FD-172 SS1]|uniref:Glycosyltransferase family 2 protein n=1 Tax=Botryobasidium botryosum (strain FD-172 SS1) TaxID=930990 RepID=A0A067MP41_BOTB1|nr:glycosyltransferase family 2 protein [Botryobasidium botryosum FD-172 SS1]
MSEEKELPTFHSSLSDATKVASVKSTPASTTTTVFSASLFIAEEHSKKGTSREDLCDQVPTLTRASDDEPDLNHPGPARVVSLSRRDDSDTFRGWRRTTFLLTPFTFLLIQGTTLAYLVLRCIYIRASTRKTGNNAYAAWLFLGVECILSLMTLIHAGWTVFLWKPRNRRQLRLVGTEGLPTADVIICCCGEDIDIIMDTVRAACAMSYPLDRFRVILSDDGGSDELQRTADALQKASAPNLIYHRRTKIKGVPHHAKAGNINAALEKSKSFDWGWDGPGEYTAFLDADMIPLPSMLRALFAHLFIDPQLAHAGLPQAYYNVPPGDLLNQDMRIFFDRIELIKDAAGVAWCTGSGYVMRRSVLDEIGGVPTASIAEDVFCSSLILGAGYRCAYVHERLQWGLVPDSFLGHIKQRTRWTLGTLQTTNNLNWWLWGARIRKLTFMQRLSGLTFGITSVLNIAVCLSLIVLPYVLFSGSVLIPVTDSSEIKLLIRITFVNTMAGRFHEILWSMPPGYLGNRRDTQALSWMAPYNAITIIRAALPNYLGGKTAGFQASGSLSDALHERTPAARAPLWRRVTFMLWECSVWIHVVLVGAIAGAVSYSLGRILRKWVVGRYTSGAAGYELLTHVFWPPLTWWVLGLGLWVPILYTFAPPDTPERDKLLERDAAGVARPKPTSTVPAHFTAGWFLEVCYSLSTAYTVGCFFLTFFLDFNGP